jgi:predicted component of type VI protein secretion system
MYKLIFEKGSLTGRIYEFSEGRIVVGRDADCRLRLRDEGVSRQHCYFEERPDGVYVCDMGSTNGVFVNNLKVTEHKLSTADRVKIGAALVNIEIEGQPPPPPPKDDEKETKTPSGPKAPTPPSSKLEPAARPSGKLDRAVDRPPTTGARQGSAPPPVPTSTVTMVLASVALLCGLGALIWLTILQSKISDLSRDVERQSYQPLLDADLGNKLEKLRQEVEELKQRQPPPRPPPAPQGATPPAAQGLAAAVNQQNRWLQFESPLVADKHFEDESADEHVEVSLRLRVAPASSFEPSKAKVVVWFYDADEANQVLASLSVPQKTISGNSSWRAGQVAPVHLTYLVPKGERLKQQQQTGQRHRFYGLAAHAYYADELQDAVFYPRDFPHELR